MLLIVDDIQVGCGRTGTSSASGLRHPNPDIITLSKSLSVSVCRCRCNDEARFDIWKRGAHSGTFRQQAGVRDRRPGAGQLLGRGRFAEETARKERMVRDWLENIVHSYPAAGLSVRGAA